MIRKNWILIVFLVLIGLILVNKTYCNTLLPAKNVLGFSPVIDKSKIFEGYTLISPYDKSAKTEGKGKVYLIDLFGKAVHTWEIPYPALYSILKKNGNLVVSLITPENRTKPGKTGIIQELDWDSKGLWEYKNNDMHHDFDVLPNGNIAVSVNEIVPKDIAFKVQGGMIGSDSSNGMISDAILEINKEGKVVWEWHSYQHLDPVMDSLGPLTPRSNWTHANSLRFVEKDPITGQEGFLISIRHINTVALINKKDGSFIWRSPKGLLAYQHDATLLANGNILIFDNGMFREPLPTVIQGSRVLEVNPKNNEVVWRFDGGDSGSRKISFLAPITSGAQRLPNGNTLIMHGPAGHLFEVTPNKEIVWDMISPYQIEKEGLWLNNSIFKARRYSSEDIDWPKKIASFMPVSSQICASLR